MVIAVCGCGRRKLIPPMKATGYTKWLCPDCRHIKKLKEQKSLLPTTIKTKPAERARPPEGDFMPVFGRPPSISSRVPPGLPSEQSPGGPPVPKVCVSKR